jgi:REP element-mobilizing transposase RayT
VTKTKQTDPGKVLPGLTTDKVTTGKRIALRELRKYYSIMEKKLIGYMLTWTTYGTWLQGDKRGYVKDGQILQADDKLKSVNEKQQKFETFKLNSNHKQIVKDAILAGAEMVNQKIIALAVCSNHVHLLVEASAESIEKVVHRYKSSGTFALRHKGIQRKIWSDGFDKRFCYTDEEIEQKIKYIQKHNNAG